MTPDEALAVMQAQQRAVALVEAHANRFGRPVVLRYEHAGDIYVAEYGNTRLQAVFSPMIPLSHKVN